MNNNRSSIRIVGADLPGVELLELLNFIDIDDWERIHSEEAIRLVKAGANPEVVSKKGDNLIHRIFYKGDAELAKEIVNLGVNLNGYNRFGQTITHLLVISRIPEAESLSIIDILASKGVDFNIESHTEMRNRNGWTPLQFSAWNGKELLVEKFISLGVDLFLSCDEEESPLNLAKSGGHHKIVESIQNEIKRIEQKAQSLYANDLSNEIHSFINPEIFNHEL
ncbi:MAG: hypothetical protein IBX55_00775 [Methyloprofundus sp.]|nr:hypothetical protein [Methyloprofundus sp.]